MLWMAGSLLAAVTVTPAAMAANPGSEPCSCGDQAGDAAATTPVRRGGLRQVDWRELKDFGVEAVSPASWQAFLLGCAVLRSEPTWAGVCDAAAALPDASGPAEHYAFLKAEFQAWQAQGPDGQSEGLATGYYEPVLRGSRLRDERFRYPLYGRPDDLLTVDLESVVPELRGRRVRARLDGNRVVPYYSRADIEHRTPDSLLGHEIVWIDDPVEVFFLHIQGSGRVDLAEGGSLHVGYADQNGQPFRSVARLLIDRGELTVAQATLQGMKAWASAHPDRVADFLDANPSYVFFRELPGDLPGPIGTLGVPLLGEASVAVDARVVPLGAPVFVDTTFPLSQQPLHRLAMAQDTGGAINGAVRIDYFWGLGDEALAQAGRMRQKLRLWVLLPRGTHPEAGALIADSGAAVLPAGASMLPAGAPMLPAGAAAPGGLIPMDPEPAHDNAAVTSTFLRPGTGAVATPITPSGRGAVTAPIMPPDPGAISNPSMPSEPGAVAVPIMPSEPGAVTVPITPSEPAMVTSPVTP